MSYRLKKLPSWWTLSAAQILYWTDPTYRALADLEHGVARYLHGFKWPDYLAKAHRTAFEHMHKRERELRNELDRLDAVKV